MICSRLFFRLSGYSFRSYFNTKLHRHRKLEPARHYKYIKANMDSTILIQVSLTLAYNQGKLPQLPIIVNMGIQFRFYWFVRRKGLILKIIFSKTSIHSILVKCCWCSNYYLMNQLFEWHFKVLTISNIWWILTRHSLSNIFEGFLNCVKFYFRNKVFDIKYIMRYCNALYGGLRWVENTLNIS